VQITLKKPFATASESCNIFQTLILVFQYLIFCRSHYYNCSSRRMCRQHDAAVWMRGCSGEIKFWLFRTYSKLLWARKPYHSYVVLMYVHESKLNKHIKLILHISFRSLCIRISDNSKSNTLESCVKALGFQSLYL